MAPGNMVATSNEMQMLQERSRVEMREMREQHARELERRDQMFAERLADMEKRHLEQMNRVAGGSVAGDVWPDASVPRSDVLLNREVSSKHDGTAAVEEETTRESGVTLEQKHRHQYVYHLFWYVLHGFVEHIFVFLISDSLSNFVHSTHAKKCSGSCKEG